MRQEIKEMEQAVASSSSFMKKLKGGSQQQATLNKAIKVISGTPQMYHQGLPLLTQLLTHP